MNIFLNGISCSSSDSTNNNRVMTLVVNIVIVDIIRIQINN